MNAAAVLFWCSAAVVVYAYAGYPLVLLILASFRERPVRREPRTPPLTVVIPVHNQAAAIRRKLENLLDLDYPRELLRIVVASDGSTDETERVVASFAPAGVRLVRSAERLGKEAAQNLALPEIRGEIVVFTDATILLEKRAFRAIVRAFADPEVGCVSSEDDVPGAGEGLYVRYEMAIRRWESRIRTLIGVSGSFYAVRAELVERTDPRYTRDFLLPLLVIEKGMRVVCEPEARGRFLPAPSAGSEFRRKTRTVLRGMDVLAYRRGLLNPFRHPFVAWALLSHKGARWAVPWALLLALAANAALLPSLFYGVCFALQLFFYLSAGGALLSRRWAGRLPGKAALFFTATNAAVLAAGVRYLAGERAVVWEPTRR
ncbi:MAG: glycosyltransferase family 2 protein [Candidatus Eisenbacteria bacterium]|nr:glycosyltransferase family 2 protein [Candidatus Eisenbacteria bacterium]